MFETNFTSFLNLYDSFKVETPNNTNFSKK